MKMTTTLTRATRLVARQYVTRATTSSTKAARFISTNTDTVCELASSNLRYGIGATSEVGQDLKEQFACEKAVVFTDKFVQQQHCFQTLLQSLDNNNVNYTIYDQVRVEPTNQSFQNAIDFLENEVDDYDAVVAMGGGSVMDTAKAANLYACQSHPVHFYDYVNPPIGRGMPVVDKILKPLIAIPTTAGTGSETTGVAIFDDIPTRSKTGIASRQLKPTLGIVDPLNTMSLPRKVAIYSGLDVLCHAMESYTALPYNQRPKPTSPLQRPAYQGSNPISDVWSLFALETAAKYLPIAVSETVDPDIKREGQEKMILASSAAGIGFGNAGVHLCHGCSYPIAAQVKDSYIGKAYDFITDHALIPHGLSVIVTAPSVFTWTSVACPDRHRTCAQILQSARWSLEQHGGENGTIQVPPTTTAGSDPGLWLADEIRHICATLDVQIGLKQFDYTVDDIPSLVDGTLPQHRVTKISPRPVQRADIENLFLAALDE